MRPFVSLRTEPRPSGSGPLKTDPRPSGSGQPPSLAPVLRGAFATTIVTGLAIFALPALAGQKGLNTDALWPQWRGPLATGIAPRGNPPLTWSETNNIRWKVPLPGLGHSTPVVWGDHIFLTAAVQHGDELEPVPEWDPDAHDNFPTKYRRKFVVLAIDRRDGSTLWQRVVRDEHPHEGTHVTGSWASNSPITDGDHLFAYFGSRGLYCLDLKGNLLWERDFGDMKTRHGHGEGSSPALHGETLVINWDHQADSFVIALDKRTGNTRWKVARDEITSWSTPLIVQHDGKHQVIIAATKRVRGYDLATGELIWECAGLSRNVVASPVEADGIVYVANSYDWQAMLAIRLSAAKGDITDTGAVVWSRDRHTPYVPSPLLYDNRLYFLKHSQGFLTCVNAGTGESLYGRKRLRGIDNVFASPVGAANRIYITGRNGTTAVVRHGDQFELLATNKLDDTFSASPVIVGNDLLLRGEQSLYCITDTPTP
ncbi:MAG: PQQ-like beta-propeller repeat protein [Phycisphaerae bacterium]|jgi:outer membrane protein assembly factor BamB